MKLSVIRSLHTAGRLKDRLHHIPCWHCLDWNHDWMNCHTSADFAEKSSGYYYVKLVCRSLIDLPAYVTHVGGIRLNSKKGARS